MKNEMKYYNWYYKSTTDDYRPSDINNKCVVLDPKLGYQWSDESCTARAYLLCVPGMYTYGYTVILNLSSHNTV